VQNAESFDAFDRVLAAEPAVTQVYRTAPSVDFTLVLTVRDMPAYHALVQRLFTAANNVRNVRARFATLRSKFSGALPLPERA
jgi:DNA-binding Lrp family transcriptional regulator